MAGKSIIVMGVCGSGKSSIGLKVATLPVIALGVGIGVDYGIYIYGKLEEYLKQVMLLPIMIVIKLIQR